MLAFQGFSYFETMRTSSSLIRCQFNPLWNDASHGIDHTNATSYPPERGEIGPERPTDMKAGGNPRPTSFTSKCANLPPGKLRTHSPHGFYHGFRAAAPVAFRHRPPVGQCWAIPKLGDCTLKPKGKNSQTATE